MSSRPSVSELLRLTGTALSIALLGLVVAAATALVVVPKATGSMPLTVLTASMSPAYQPGSVVVVRPTPVEELQIGDAITFQERSGDPTVVTHRIVAIGFAGDGSRQLVTQGDANGAPDPQPVREEQVRGKVWYSVPYAGQLTTIVDPALRQLAVKVVAGALLAYAGYMITAGALGRRRRRGDRRRDVVSA